VATLIQAVLLGGLFIMLPLVLLRRHRGLTEAVPSRLRSDWSSRLLVLFYFLALGVGYLFVETDAAPPQGLAARRSLCQQRS
jgi:hypothetical protein